MKAELRIRAVAGGQFAANWNFDGATRTITSQIPVRRLDALGVGGRLETPGGVSVDVPAREYARLLARSLDLEGAVAAWGVKPTLVLAVGEAAESDILWETLRLLGKRDSPVVVVRVLREAETDNDAVDPAPPTICWLGSRESDDPLPRFGILGKVLCAIRPYDTIRPRMVRTALETIDGVDLGTGGILHLDAHGLVKSDPGLGASATRRTVGISVGGNFVSSDELLTHIARVCPKVLVSNACHTSNHVQEDRAFIPTVLNSVDSVRAVAASYGTLATGPAGRFAAEFYASLAAGKAILIAHQRGLANALVELDDPDEVAKATIQQVLWIRTTNVARLQLCAESPAAEAENEFRWMQSVLLQLASLGLVVGETFEAVEDRSTAGDRRFPQLAFATADWDERTARQLGVAIHWALGSLFTEPTPDAPIEVRGISTPERSSLLHTLFASQSPLIDVLAELVPSLRALAELEILPGERLGVAVLKASRTGRTQTTTTSVDGAFNDRYGAVPSQHFLVSGCFPIVAVGSSGTVLGRPVAILVGSGDDRSLLARVLTTGEDPTGSAYARFNAGFGHLCREHADPTLVAATFLRTRADEQCTHEHVQWDALSIALLASELVGITACRQAGVIDPLFTSTAMLIAQHSYSDAVDFLECLNAGLPGWKPLHKELRAALNATIIELRDGDRSRSSPSPEPSTDWRDALAAGDRDTVRRLAHDLIDKGEPDNAMKIAVALLANPRRLDRHDVAENYHLMAHAQEALGQTHASVQWMKKERDVPPPTLHRRLHCLAHLFSVMRTDGARPEDLYAVVQEGLAVAREGDGQADVDRWLHKAITLGLDAERPDWLETNLDAAEDSPLCSDPLLDLARGLVALDRDGDASQYLRSAATGGGNVAAHAALLLARIEPRDTDELLWRGVSEAPNGSYRSACADELILRALSDNGLTAIMSILDRLQLAGVRTGLWAFALGAHQAEAEEEDQAVATLLGMLLDPTGPYDRALEAIGGPESSVARLDRLVITAIINAATFSVRQSSQELWPRIDQLLFAFLPRLGGLSPAVCTDVVNGLRLLSDELWDDGGRQQLEFAATLRSHACDVLEAIDSPVAKELLATELGWLAVLYRQSERWDEARVSFRRALRVADVHSSQVERALIRGRYGNLLDSIGDHTAAVFQQWAAICDSVGLPLETPQTTDNALEALRLGPPALVVINWSNCLEHAGDREMAMVGLAWVWENTDDGDRSAEMKRLISSLARRLG